MSRAGAADAAPRICDMSERLSKAPEAGVHRMSQRRVVITGMGMISPLGNDLASSWDAIVNSRSGLGPITSFDASLFTTRIAGEIRDFDPTVYMSPKDVKKMDCLLYTSRCV